MESPSPSTCRACEKRGDGCAVDKPREAGEAAGGRLVALAAGVFLLPLVAAIVAAAVAGPDKSVLAGSAALAASLAAVAGVATWYRGRRSAPKP